MIDQKEGHVKCPVCGGSGKLVEWPCFFCDGDGSVTTAQAKEFDSWEPDIVEMVANP